MTEDNSTPTSRAIDWDAEFSPDRDARLDARNAYWRGLGNVKAAVGNAAYVAFDKGWKAAVAHHKVHEPAPPATADEGAARDQYRAEITGMVPAHRIETRMNGFRDGWARARQADKDNGVEHVVCSDATVEHLAQLLRGTWPTPWEAVDTELQDAYRARAARILASLLEGP